MRLVNLLIILLIGANMYSQPVTYTEEEIQLQDKFIEANREKLLGKYDKAIEILETVLEKDKKNDAVSYELARLYHQQKEVDLSLKHIDKAIRWNADNEWYGLFKSQVLTEEKKYAEAARVYERLVRIDPDNDGYYDSWTENLLKSANEVGALNALTQWEERRGVQEMISLKKFEIYATQDDQKKAIAELNKMTDLYPRDVRYMNNLASYYKQIGKKKDAEKVHKAILKIDPTHGPSVIALAGDVTKKGNEHAYFTAIRTVIQNPKIDIDRKIKELIPYVSKMGNDEEYNTALLGTVDELYKAHSNNPKATAIYGDVLMNTGATDKAIEMYGRTIENNPNVYAVWEQLMYAHEEEKNIDKLAEVSLEAMDLYPNQAACYYFNAQASILKVESMHATKEELFMRGMTQKQYDQKRKELLDNAEEMISEAALMVGNNDFVKQRLLQAQTTLEKLVTSPTNK